MSSLNEEWRPIKGYEDRYAVSSLGRVKSIARPVSNGHKERMQEERIMAQHVWMDYLVVWLRRPGEHRKFRVHRLVAEAFLTDPHSIEVVNHKDGNKRNNRLDNLEWATYSENTKHYHDVLKPERHVFKPADLPF